MKLMVYKQKTIINPNSLKFQIFKDILKADKVNGDAVLIYVFLSCDLSADNPILEIPYSRKEEEARLIAFGSEDYDIEKELGPAMNQMVMEAKRVYKTEIVTDEQKDILAYDKKLDQFSEMLEITHPTIERNENSYGFISYSTNIEIINGVLRDIVSLIQAKASLIAMMVQGTVPKNLRGGLSPNTKGKIQAQDAED